MIVLQLPSVCRSTIGDYSRDRPRTLQNDSLLRRSILFLRMLIDEMKIAARPRSMEKRSAKRAQGQSSGLCERLFRPKRFCYRVLPYEMDVAQRNWS